MKNFIEIHTIASTPGNPTSRTFLRIDVIEGVSIAPEEFAKIGASCRIDTRIGTILAIENIEDVIGQIEKSQTISA